MKMLTQLCWLGLYAAALLVSSPGTARSLTTNPYPLATAMFPIKIEMTERNPADLSARAHREISRQSFQAVGETWQQQILPPRFTPGSPHYPFKPRTKKYLKQKELLAARGRALYGGHVINVLTGNMAEILSRPGVIHAFPTRATVKKVGPRYVTMRPYESKQPDKWAELVYLKRDEKRRLNRTAGETYDRLRRQVQVTRKFSTG